MKNCKNCNKGFEITDEDREFYKKFEVPESVFCPACRQQRRLSWRNERNIYKRKCDLTGKDFVSNYSPDKPFTVYSPEAWYSDDWDGLEYGMDLLFSYRRVPFIGRIWEGSLPAFATEGKYTGIGVKR